MKAIPGIAVGALVLGQAVFGSASGASASTCAETPIALVAAPAEQVDYVALTKCDSSGTVLTFDSAAGLEMEIPGLGETVTAFTSFDGGASGATKVEVIHGDDNSVAWAVTEPTGSNVGGTGNALIRVQAATAASSASVQVTPMGATPPAGKCSSTRYVGEGYTQIGSYVYYINTSGAPSGATARLNAAATNVAGAVDGCGLSGSTGIGVTYKGTTTAATGVTATGGCSGNDGKNTLKWGDLPSTKAAVTCIWSNGIGWVLAADTKFNNSKTWYAGASSTGCSGTKIDVQGLAMHEIGHAFGLNDLYTTGSAYSSQVMWWESGSCQTYNRLYGSGDHAGLMALY